MSRPLDLLDGGSGPDRFAYDGFASLLAPLDSTTFFERYWEQTPFLVQRNKADYFADLFGLTDVDRLIGSHLFRDGDIRIAKDGAMKPFAQFSHGGVVDRNAVLREYGNGATIVFEHLNRHHPALGHAIACSEVELKFPLRVNSYLTPARARGFSRHYDTHDVLVLQVGGTKTWQIYDNPLPLPHEEQTYAPSWGEQAQQIAEVTLRPGDVLYLPRGYIHGASANEESSLHLTIGMRSLTLRDVAVAAVKHAALALPALRQVARFRGQDPGETLARTRRLLHELVERTDVAALFDDVLFSVIKKRARPMDGRLLELADTTCIDHATLLRMRPDCLLHLFERAGQVSLRFDGGNIILPLGVQDAIRFMQDQASFCAAQLPGMEHESQLILVRKLRAEGLLQTLEAVAPRLQSAAAQTEGALP